MVIDHNFGMLVKVRGGVQNRKVGESYDLHYKEYRAIQRRME